MKEIPLTQGYVALVSDEDYDRVAANKWHVEWFGYGYPYAVCKQQGRRIFMHRFVLGIATDAKIDHRNQKTLDNRRENLRVATNAENARNSKSRGGSSKFKGVHFHHTTNKWIARIGYEGKRYHLGLFSTEEEAARAYDEAAKLYHREYARLNFPDHGNLTHIGEEIW